MTPGRRDTKVRKEGTEDTGKKRNKFKKLKIQKQKTKRKHRKVQKQNIGKKEHIAQERRDANI